MKQFCLTFALACMLATAVAAQVPTPSLSKTSELASAGSVVNLPGLTIHGGRDKFIEAEGKVALTDGILEFIAVQTEGREYESLLTLDCKPSELKFALLLIGCEPGETNGSSLVVEVESQGKRTPVEQWLIDRRTKKSPAKLTWRFTGSRFVNDPLSGREVFQADQETAFIALWWQPAILINVVGEFGNPYRAADQGFEVNKSAVPSKGTPVKLIFRKRS